MYVYFNAHHAAMLASEPQFLHHGRFRIWKLLIPEILPNGKNKEIASSSSIWRSLSGHQRAIVSWYFGRWISRLNVICTFV